MRGYQKGHIGYTYWKDKKFTDEHRKNLSESHKGKPSSYKGIVTSNSYGALHHWVIRNLIKSNVCQICKKKKNRLEWANINHTYKRIKEDWITLCVRCHRLHDIINNNYYEKWISTRRGGIFVIL